VCEQCVRENVCSEREREDGCGCESKCARAVRESACVCNVCEGCMRCVGECV